MTNREIEFNLVDYDTRNLKECVASAAVVSVPNFSRFVCLPTSVISETLTDIPPSRILPIC